MVMVYPWQFLVPVKKSDSKTFEILGEQKTKQIQDNKKEGKQIYNYQLLNFSKLEHFYFKKKKKG